MSADPPTPLPTEPAAKPDYAHLEDGQAQRARYELWVIVALVVLVLGAAFTWRAVTGRRAGPERGWEHPNPGAAANVAVTGAGVPARGATSAPAPRPVGAP